MKTSTNKRPKRKEGGARRDYRQEVTSRIIEAIEAGAPPWSQGYYAAALPFNAITGRSYRGMNTLSLQIAASKRGHTDPRWMTYRQAEARGWQVRRGEKAVCVEYWDWRGVRGNKAADDDVFDISDAFSDALGDDVAVAGEERKQPRVYYAYVFNAEQIDGVPALNIRQRDATELDGLIEKWVSATGANIVHQNPYPTISYPHYLRSKDYCYVPPKEKWGSIERYHATTMHELGHWTGHESRLNREFGKGKDTPEYAREELRAEMASAMICAELGIVDSTMDDHAGYIDSWLEMLRNDKNEIFRAAKAASEMADYLFQFAPQEVLDYRQGIIDQAVAISREAEQENADTIEVPDFGAVNASPRVADVASMSAIMERLAEAGWQVENGLVAIKDGIMVSGTALSSGSGYFLVSVWDRNAWVPPPSELRIKSIEFEDAPVDAVIADIGAAVERAEEFLKQPLTTWEAAVPVPPSEPATRDEAVAALQFVRPFMPKGQLAAIAAACRGEEKQFFFDRLVRLQNEIKDAPKTYDQDGKGDDAIVCFHYFYGGSDWFITELDKEDKGTEQAFGYVCMNGWVDSAELGYISIDELVENGIELDLYWKPKTLSEVKRELHGEHPRDPALDEATRKAEAEFDAACVPSGMAWDTGVA